MVHVIPGAMHEHLPSLKKFSPARGTRLPTLPSEACGYPLPVSACGHLRLAARSCGTAKRGAQPPTSRGARPPALQGTARSHCFPVASHSRHHRPTAYKRCEPLPISAAEQLPLVNSTRRRAYILPSSKEMLRCAEMHVASVCIKCFICFRRMLQVFQIDVAKLDRDVAYVAMVVHVCCKGLFPVFHLCF
jgi:hypothetical protein